MMRPAWVALHGCQGTFDARIGENGGPGGDFAAVHVCAAGSTPPLPTLGTTATLRRLPPSFTAGRIVSRLTICLHVKPPPPAMHVPRRQPRYVSRCLHRLMVFG